MQSMFNNIHSVTINGGMFSQHNNPKASSSSLEAFERLEKAVAPGAFHNSGERFDPPKCHPRTRLAVTERIRNWILGKESTNSFVMWLNGPAGAGKSAIAQKIAELCHENELLASFFFCGSDPRRNHPNSLFPTIAYQIACAIPPTRSLIEQEISRDPLIFTRNLEAQMIALVVKPLQPLVASGYFSGHIPSPSLIIIDGLDEVVDRQAQTKILEAISSLLGRHRLPLIFLIASRPEQEIVHAFSTQPLSELLIRLTLDDRYQPDDDIRLFLEESFSQVKAEHPRRNLIPTSWPSATVMDSIVLKASGQFIYAATVIRFIKSLRHRPVDRLEIILGLRPVQCDMPFAELDALYMHILLALEDPDRTLLIVGVILVKGYDFALAILPFIEQFLGLDAGDGEFLLADLTSLLSWDKYGVVRILHASFGDFLFDPLRSGKFAIDRKAMHTIMACHCLRRLNLTSSGDPRTQALMKFMIDWVDGTMEYALRNAGQHLSESSPSPELMVHLRAISFKRLMDNIDLHVSLNRHKDYLVRDAWKSMFDFFSAVEKLDFDQSEYHSLRPQLFDQVIQNECDLLYAMNPSLPFLLCLKLLCTEKEIPHFYTDHRWTRAILRVTGWNTDARQEGLPMGRPDVLVFDSDMYAFLFERCELRKFLSDASRSGKYTVDAKTYAGSSLSCLEYLSRLHLEVPINLRYTQRYLTRRRNTPWLWRQHRYLQIPRSLQDLSPYTLTFSSRSFSLPFARRSQRFSLKFCGSLLSRQEYMDATYLALKFLPKALLRAAKSDALIAFAKADKPFNQCAMKLPANTKKCKVAIAAYLERVQQDSGTQPHATDT